jgi:LacI family transcriptional regulator
MTTIKEIADLAGVSRGTVDRVLNNRGSVNPQTEQKILDIIQQLDYRPNRAGTVLAAQKKKYRIGVILFSEHNPFFDEVMEGVLQKSEELKDYGVTTLTLRVEFDVEAQLQAIDHLLAEGIHGLMLAPCNDIRIQKKINELVEQQIPVVTVNTDIEGSRRIAYVGSDHTKGGQTAAGLFALMTEGEVELGIILGSSGVLCHTERVQGLRNILEASYPRIHVTQIKENHDDEEESYQLTRKMLEENPNMNALFFAAGGVYGGCRAIRESGRHPKVITFDEVPTTLEMLRAGIISATISQQPYRQGSYSLNILFEYLTSGTIPNNERNIVELSIKIRENLE